MSAGPSDADVVPGPPTHSPDTRPDAHSKKRRKVYSTGNDGGSEKDIIIDYGTPQDKWYIPKPSHLKSKCWDDSVCREIGELHPVRNDPNVWSPPHEPNFECVLPSCRTKKLRFFRCSKPRMAGGKEYYHTSAVHQHLKTHHPGHGEQQAQVEELASTFDEQLVVGVLGGGQLGRMMGEAASRLGVKLVALDPNGSKAPASLVCYETIKHSFKEPEGIKALAKACDIITYEIEHVDVDTLRQLAEGGKVIHPDPFTVAIIQDKLHQKEHFAASQIPMGKFAAVNSVQDIEKIAEGKDGLGFPLMLKSRLGAYDGRGNAVIRKKSEIERAFNELGGNSGNKLYVEQWVPFTQELAVMVAKSNKEIKCYDVVRTIQKNNICHTVMAPALCSWTSKRTAQKLARKAVESLKGNGIFGVEMFLLPDGQVFMNEVAPRPHNSGHYTIEACECDQFEQHLRAIMGMPLGSCEMRVGCALMVNILGTEANGYARAQFKTMISVPGAGAHWYGKDQDRRGRKMGHVTITAPSLPILKDRAKMAKVEFPGDELSSKSRLAVAAASEASSAVLSSNSTAASAKPLVGIIMGSDSDLPTMKDAAEILSEFKIPFELTIVSAHRTPDRLVEYAKGAADRGLACIIAGAGGAAHLPGMVAAMTPLPVIGVPVKTSALSGMDSLYSIVQMPRGVPVATVAIGNATNAGLLAARFLGAASTQNVSPCEHVLGSLKDYQDKASTTVCNKAEQVEAIGWEAYMAQASAPKSKTVM